jgi:BirA family biotin operon repressor/biotin-[acetyl-CoA-carboxylase] ligase
MNSAANWPTQQIEQTIAPHLPDLHVEVLTQIESTNSELMRRARNGQREPVLMVAEHQTAGRGRMGRRWLSAEGKSSSLTFSLGLTLSPQEWSGLSLVAGLSIVRSLHADLRLKWPNDIWLHGRKLAGILIETASVGKDRFVVVGVGINIKQQNGSDLATPPAALEELLPEKDPPRTLLQIAAPLVHAIKMFEASGFAPFQAGFNERDALAGANVSLSDGTFGVAHGVNGIGALQLHTASGRIDISSAEVSLRPVGTSAFAMR